MRIRMSSPLLLLVGLIVGLLAMWASVSPIGSTGDLVTGGWTWCIWDGEYYACASRLCDSDVLVQRELDSSLVGPVTRLVG